MIKNTVAAPGAGSRCIRISEFYYLQSRYYNASVCRFINADNYTTTCNDMLGYNMFAYCGNNPVSRNDDNGEFWNIVIGAAIVGAAGGAIAATGLGSIAQAGATALASGVGDAVQQGIDKGWDKIDPLQGTKTALVGGATSLIGSYAGKKFLGGIEDAGNAVDAFGTTLTWAEGSTLIACAEIIVTNIIAVTQLPSRNTSTTIRRNSAMHDRTMLLM